MLALEASAYWKFKILFVYGWPYRSPLARFYCITGKQTDADVVTIVYFALNT